MTTSTIPMPVTNRTPVPIKKRRVLLVDMSRAKRDLRSETMRRLGIDVDCAADIGEARGWWRADLYNLVLMNLENDMGHRDQFCEELRGATPPQQIAFLVGKPEYLSNVPNADGAVAVQEETDQALLGEVKAALSADATEPLPQRWGILEASRRISAVRSASHARTSAMRDRPTPPRDSEMRLSRRTSESRTLDELLREEMR
jgi:CheY-like chemotaxis protein